MDKKYFFYIIARDYGFAPNPFYGFCTLACCKSKIRKKAEKGDWIIGLGSEKLKCRGSLIFAMKITEKPITFSEYYKDPRFILKKPVIKSSLKAIHGDNVYHKNSKGVFIQDDCHHHHKCLDIRKQNIKKDTKVDRVLISDHFFYFGDNYLSSQDNKLFIKVKREFKGLLQSDQVNGTEKIGKELINFLEEKYKKNYIYGDPISWGSAFYKRQFK